MDRTIKNLPLNSTLWGSFLFLLFCFSADLAASGYLGSEACKECHAKAYEAWQGSHHQQAMDVATEKNVLGDFNDTTFTYNYNGVTTHCSGS